MLWQPRHEQLALWRLAQLLGRHRAGTLSTACEGDGVWWAGTWTVEEGHDEGANILACLRMVERRWAGGSASQPRSFPCVQAKLLAHLALAGANSVVRGVVRGAGGLLLLQVGAAGVGGRVWGGQWALNGKKGLWRSAPRYVCCKA